MEEAFSYEKDYRYEMILGDEKIMSPIRFRHYVVQENLKDILKAYLKSKPDYMLLSDFAVYFDEKNWLQPDIFIINDKSRIKESYVEGAPEFIVEILSPATYMRDIGIKKDTYETYGVKEYWTIDPDSRIITAYLLKDNKFVLDNVYHAYAEDSLKLMTKKEKSEIQDKINLSIFDDLTINVSDIFSGDFL